MNWPPLWVAAALVQACSSPAPTAPAPASDEVTLRTVLGLPASTRLIHLASDPRAGGTFGREGLRIVAELEIPPSDLSTFLAAARARPRWTTALPATVGTMRQGPTEIPASAHVALAYCEAGAWIVGTTFSTEPCDPLPPRLDRYRVAVIDGVTGRVHVVFKNYY